MVESLKLYTATGCEPCNEIKQALEDGNYEVLGVEGGAPKIEEFGLFDDAASIEEAILNSIESTPTAFYGTKQCKILRNEDNSIVFDCRGEEGSGQAI